MLGGRGGGGDCEPPGSDVESQKSGDQSGKPGNATDGATGTPSSENLGDPSQAAQSVLQVFDLRMGVMRNEFQMQLQQQMQHMQQLHDDHMEKLRADLSRAFNSCTEANNNTQKDVGQLDLRLQRLEFQHGVDMTRISSDFGEFSDVMGGIQEEQIQQAQRLERVEQQLQRATWVQQEGFKPHKSSLKGGKVGPQLPQMTLSPIGGEFAQRQGVRWSTPTSANMGHYPNKGSSCFDKRFTQHHSYGNYERFGERGYEFSDRGAYGGAQSRGGQQWPGDKPYHGPSKVSNGDEDLVKDYGEQKKK